MICGPEFSQLETNWLGLGPVTHTLSGSPWEAPFTRPSLGYVTVGDRHFKDKDHLGPGAAGSTSEVNSRCTTLSAIWKSHAAYHEAEANPSYGTGDSPLHSLAEFNGFLAT